jgi:hypothetical protein
MILASGRVMAEQKGIHWRGQVASVTSFSTGSVPDDVCAGATISGHLIYNPDHCLRRSYIMGDSSGYKHTFSNQFEQTIMVSTNEWKITGGFISFIYNRNMPWNAVDVFSTQDTSQYQSFPKYVGTHEVGFAVFDDTSPYDLYASSYNITNAAINWHQICFANGFLTTRRWDENRDIVEGYYMTFDIDAVFPASIPPDTDNDRLPDSWEQEHFGGVTNATPDALCSNDVNTTREAYIAGLDPNNSDSHFAVLIDADDLHWTSVSGRTYTVYKTTNLMNGFQPFMTDIPWTEDTCSITNNLPTSFYKLGVQMEGVYLDP